MREDDVDEETTANDDASETTPEAEVDDRYDLDTPGLTMDELVAVLI